MGVDAVSNEHHDVVCARAAEMGFEANHAVEQEQTGSDDLFIRVTNNAFAGRPPLKESGLRILIMAKRSNVPIPALQKQELRQLREVTVTFYDGLTLPVSHDHGYVIRVFELIMGVEVTALGIGRRASLLAYAINRSIPIRRALPNFTKIGERWGLSAENKRSAVSAAMNQLRAEMIKHGQLPSTFRFWFEKSADARAVYEAAQMGNTNRQADDDEDADTEHEVMMLDGVPLKPCYARMKAGERRERLHALHEASEMKRLGLSAEAGILNRR